MSRVTLSSFIGIAALSVSSVLAQTSTFPATPLASKTFAHDNLPYQADTDTNLIRGTQHGYNICNSTTEGEKSLCQTSYLNGPDDFCLWAPSEPNSVIANTEGEEVAWCTKPGHGTRLIPAGALQGLQFIKTPGYVQIVGFIDQSKINIQSDDFGGELDPHGADLRGNPMGGLFYSTAFNKTNTPSSDGYVQVHEWTNFMGGNAFCIKACDPSVSNAAELCQHIYDRIGCFYNMPNQAQNGTFESCEGENQDPPGVYTSNGQVMTYTQPAEGIAPSPADTYTPRVPASSSCTTFTSASLFASLPSASGASASASGSGKGTSATGSPKGSGTATGSAAGASGTGNSAVSLTISGVSLAGVIMSAIFLS